MKIYLDNNLGVSNVEQEELTQDTIGYNILKVYIPNAVLTPYNTFTCYYGALLQNGRKVGWFAMEARTSSDADYEANYTLYKATLEQCVVSVEGKVYIGCQVLLGNSGNATLIKKNTAVVQFNVRKSVAINNDILVLDTDQTTTDVLESYKQLLENALTTYATKANTYTKTEVNSALALKADKSNTYTKDEVDTINLNLAGQIAGARVELNNKINVTNTQLGITNDKVTTLQNNTYSKIEVNNIADGLSDDIDTLQNNTYTKTEVDGKLDLKADKSDTYTKDEVDTINLNLAGQIAGARVELNNRINTTNNILVETNAKVASLETDVDTLQDDIADLKSVQNVVEVVATKSALNSYDTSKLDVNDKVQVIADESHDGASTIYNWSGSAWQYIGAFGGNSYTKAETYNKTQIDSALLLKADKSNTYTKTEVNGRLEDVLQIFENVTYTKTEIDGKFEEVGETFEIVGNEVLKKANAEYISKGTTITQTSYSNTNPSKSGKVKLYKLGGMSYKVDGTIKNSEVYAIHSMNGSNIYNNLSIPSYIRNIEGYGWGINDTCYNYIDFDRKVFVQKVGRVLGSTYENDIIIATTSGGLICVVIQTDENLIANNDNTIVQLNNLGLTNVSASSQWTTDEINVIACNDQKRILINFDQSLTESEMIEKAKTLILYFKFITPIETDISSYISKDTLDVVEGGTLEFLNTYNQAVPNEVAYIFNAVTLNNIVDSNGNTNVIATKQELNEKSKVVANPTLAGTEADLTGLEVNGTKYKVPQGSSGGGATLDDIVDSQGNKRFIEGDIVGKTPQSGGIKFTYGKWSLSGTHLMLVLCFYLNQTITITANTQLCNSINLPNWIKKKIVVQYASIIDYKEFYAFGSENKYMKVKCMKLGGTDVVFSVGEDFTPVSGQYHFRIQFDFLIDAE